MPPTSIIYRADNRLFDRTTALFQQCRWTQPHQCMEHRALHIPIRPPQLSTTTKTYSGCSNGLKTPSAASVSVDIIYFPGTGACFDDVRVWRSWYRWKATKEAGWYSGMKMARWRTKTRNLQVVSICLPVYPVSNDIVGDFVIKLKASFPPNIYIYTYLFHQMHAHHVSDLPVKRPSAVRQATFAKQLCSPFLQISLLQISLWELRYRKLQRQKEGSYALPGQRDGLRRMTRPGHRGRLDSHQQERMVDRRCLDLKRACQISGCVIKFNFQVSQN